MERLKLGMAGTGAFAARMAQAIETSPDVELAAVLSGDPVRADAFADEHGGEPFTDMTRMCEAVDAVYIAGATGAHEPASLTALAEGRPVLCEKPMATDVAGTERVIETARSRDTLFMEGFWTCHLPSWQAAKARLADGTLGEAKTLSADFSHPTSRTDNPRVWSADDGVLRDRGVYPVCLALWMYGPAKLSEAHVTREDGVDAEARLVLEHETGAVSVLTTSLLRSIRNRAVVEGTKGALTIVEPLLGSQHISKGAARMEGERSQNRFLRKSVSLAAQFRAERFPFGADQYHPQFAHFAELVRDGAKESPIVPHELSAGTARIIEEARQA